MTAVIRPVQATYKDTGLGGNIKYVIEIMGENDKEEIVPIHPRDYEIQKFRNFNLTKQSLENKESLDQYLATQMQLGKLACKIYSST